MVLHIKPVANILPVAVDRQRLADLGHSKSSAESIFREIEIAHNYSNSWWSTWAIRRCDDRREPGGRTLPWTPHTGCSAHKRWFRKMADRRSKRSINFIRGNMKKAEICFLVSPSSPQKLRASSSKANVPSTFVRMKVLRAAYRAVDVAFGCEMHDGLRLAIAARAVAPGCDQQCRQEQIHISDDSPAFSRLRGFPAYVSLSKFTTEGEVAHHCFEDEVSPDKARSTRDQDRVVHSESCAESLCSCRLELESGRISYCKQKGRDSRPF